jgi:hypothetical protein
MAMAMATTTMTPMATTAIRPQDHDVKPETASGPVAENTPGPDPTQIPATTCADDSLPRLG